MPSYLGADERRGGELADRSVDDEAPGVALKAVKEKWTHLGPLKLEDIIANSSESINQTLQFG